MKWPNATTYAEVVQNPSVAFRDQQLRTGQVAANAMGLPQVWQGNFAAVFQVQGTANHDSWAVKCFTRHVPGLQERYRAIGDHLHQKRLPFMVDFRYLPNEVTVGQEMYPALKMDWVEGLPLDEFLADCLTQPNYKSTLRMLCDMWLRLARMLREANVGHGDLQHGNVLLVPDRAKEGAYNLRLIDYDGMYVPSLANSPSHEAGHAAYQHPQRMVQDKCGPEVDRFSHLLIYTTLRCLITGGRGLWERHYDGDRLLLGPQDLTAPNESIVFRNLWRLNRPAAQNLVGHLLLASRGPIDQVPLLDEIVEDTHVLKLTEAQRQDVGRLLSRRASKPPPPPPESVLVTCVCGQSFRASPDLLGKKVPCPNCSSTIEILNKHQASTTETDPPAQSIVVTCECGLSYWAQPYLLGRVVPCPSCQSLISVHASSDAYETLESLAPREPMSHATPLTRKKLPDSQSRQNDIRLTVIVTGVGILAVFILGVLLLFEANRKSSLSEDDIVLQKPARDEGPVDPDSTESPASASDMDPLAETLTADRQAQAKAEAEHNEGREADQPYASPKNTAPPPIPEPKPSPARAIAPFDATRAQRYQQQWADFLGSPVEITNSINMKLVLIPPGEFMMGSPESDTDVHDDEKPQHTVRITQPYYLGATEVTQAQYQQVMGQNPSSFSGDLHRPVERVSRDDAVEFCRKLTEEAGRTYRLPTEAEWEYACRAGTTSKWYFGDGDSALAKHGWHSGNAGGSTHPVSSRERNAWGLFDMHGNVWEWCADWYADYGASVLSDPTGPDAGQGRVRRGGGWLNYAAFCRSANRGRYLPEFRNNYLGFRVVAVRDIVVQAREGR